MENRQTSKTIEMVLDGASRELYHLSEEELAATGLDEETLELVSRLAQMGHEKRKRRQAEGIAAAQARGVQFGRPPIETPPNFETILEEYDAGKIPLKTALRLCGMSMSTFYNRRREYRRMQTMKASGVNSNRG